MPIWVAILLGAVQGLAEFLPISSSGHLVLVQSLVDFGQYGADHVTFDVVLHLGTLTAVVVAFWGDVKSLVVEFIKMLFDGFKLRKRPYRRMPRGKRMIAGMMGDQIQIKPQIIRSGSCDHRLEEQIHQQQIQHQSNGHRSPHPAGLGDHQQHQRQQDHTDALIARDGDQRRQPIQQGAPKSRLQILQQAKFK